MTTTAELQLVQFKTSYRNSAFPAQIFRTRKSAPALLQEACAGR
jgi:hypothetical protein